MTFLHPNSVSSRDFRFGIDIEVFFIFVKNTSLLLFFFWSIINRAMLCVVGGCLF